MTRATRRGRQTLIVGYGNTWMGDDGAGPAVVDRLARMDGIEAQQSAGRLRLLTFLQLLPELAIDFAAIERVVLIDAAIDRSPGVVSLRRVLPTSSAPSLGHRWSPGALASLALSMQGRCARIGVYTIGGESFEPGRTLSPLVEQSVANLAARLASRLV